MLNFELISDKIKNLECDLLAIQKQARVLEFSRARYNFGQLPGHVRQPSALDVMTRFRLFFC